MLRLALLAVVAAQDEDPLPPPPAPPPAPPPPSTPAEALAQQLRGMPDERKQFLLLEKIEDKDFAAAEQILASGLSVNEPIHSQNKQPLVNVVTTKRDAAGLDWLISKGANLGQQDRDGRSPICHAVYHDDVEMAKKLITAAKSKGADLNMNCENGDKVNAISHA